MLEAREKVEYLASHQGDVADAVESLKRSNQTQLYKLREKLINVCTDIHKLHFQYTALYSTFSKIADMITELRKRTALDLSDLVGDLASRLFQAQLNPDLASLSSSMSGEKSPTREVTDTFTLSTLPEHQPDIQNVSDTEVVKSERSEDLTPQPLSTVSVRSRTQSAASDKSSGSTKEGLKPKVSIIDKLVSPAKHSKRSKRSHRRGFSEANIGMFRNVELELFDDLNKASSSYNLCTQSQASLSISSSSPKTSRQTTPQVSPNPSPSKSSVLSKSPSEGGFQPLHDSSPKAASSLEIYVAESKLQLSEDDTVSMTSEIPPPPTPGSECSEKSFDLPLPLPPAEAYYTSPQIARKEFKPEEDEEVVIDGLIDIEAIQIDITSDNMFNMDSSGDLCMDMMNLKVEGEERQRNTSSNYSDSNSEFLSSSPRQDHARNMSSSSDSSYRAKQKAIPIPNRSNELQDTITSSDFTFYSTNTVTPSMFNSPTNNLYQGIMSTLTTHQIILLINDHIEAHNDTAAIEVLHQARGRHGAYYFGVDTSEDVLCLLGIFCQCLGVNSQGKIALWGHGQNDIDSGNMMANTVMLEQCVYNFASNS